MRRRAARAVPGAVFLLLALSGTVGLTRAIDWGPVGVAGAGALDSGPGGTRAQTPAPPVRANATAEPLRITGGVGYRQFLRVAQWLAGNLIASPGAPRLWFSYHLTGRGFRDSVLELASHEAELTLVNGRSVGAMAVAGRGMFPKPIAELRAIAALPHYDWALFGVDASLGVRSFADLRAKKVPLKLATGFLDGDSAVGFICIEILRRHGITAEDVKGWGGALLPGGPSENRNDMLSGRANAVCQEGARGEEWEDLARKRPLTFLSIEPAVASALQSEIKFPTLTVPGGYYPGQPDPFVAADFSDWLICVRADMSDALAYRLAQIAVEKREQLDREYATEPPRYSSINYPLDPHKLARTAPVPLHAGAARYYGEKGLQP